MPTLGLLAEPLTSAAAGRAADRVLLARARARGHGTLRISGLADDVLALGRWHLCPAGGAGVVTARRLGGGRAAASGAGFVHVSLALPHRSALSSESPLALAPEQVLNRAVRGVLGGLEAMGVAVLYPGRDLLTAAGRPLGVLGLEVDRVGATLVEAVLSVERDQSVLPHLLERADRTGVVVAPMLSADDVTCVARVLDRVPSFDELVAAIRHAYETRLGVAFVLEEPPDGPPDADAFVRSRLPRPELDRRARTATMLGTLETHCALGDDGRLREVMLVGDFLAPSDTVARLEESLRGCPASLAAIAEVIDHVVRPPADFVLGIHPLGTIAETIMRAVR